MFRTTVNHIKKGAIMTDSNVRKTSETETVISELLASFDQPETFATDAFEAGVSLSTTTTVIT